VSGEASRDHKAFVPTSKNDERLYALVEWTIFTFFCFGLKYDSKVKKTVQVHDIVNQQNTRLTTQELEWITTYCKN